MTLSKIIPNYILINGIVIGGTVLVFFLVYRRLSSSFRKRLTAYFLKAACVSLVFSLAVLAVVLAVYLVVATVLEYWRRRKDADE